MLRYKRALVVGAEGMLGTDLSHVFEQEGLIVYRAGLAESVRHLDITQIESIEGQLNRIKPDVVINCAAYTAVDKAESEPELAMLVNGVGPGLLAKACYSFGVPICTISTDYVFDGDKESGYVETDTPNPLGAYAVSKYAGEVSVTEENANHWIVRTSWLYGIHGKSFPATIISAAQQGRPLRVVADQTGCPTYTVDLADSIFRILQAAPYGIYHAAGSGKTTWYEFAKRILELADIKHPISRITTIDWPTPARRPPNSILLSEAMKNIGLTPIRYWEEGLSAYIEQWKESHKS